MTASATGAIIKEWINEWFGEGVSALCADIDKIKDRASLARRLDAALDLGIDLL